MKQLHGIANLAPVRTMRGEGEGEAIYPGIAFGHRLNPTLNAAPFKKNLGSKSANGERTVVLHGLSGTKRESPILKGFFRYKPQHQNRPTETFIPLK
jgi:hypothetical protein